MLNKVPTEGIKKKMDKNSVSIKLTFILADSSHKIKWIQKKEDKKKQKLKTTECDRKNLKGTHMQRFLTHTHTHTHVRTYNNEQIHKEKLDGITSIV